MMPAAAQSRTKPHKPPARIAASPRPRVSASLFVFLAIPLATLIAYWPALQGGFVWDDNAHVTTAAMRSFHGLWRIWFSLGATQQYYPLLHSAFWLEHRLWGDAVLGYHLVNVAQHASLPAWSSSSCAVWRCPVHGWQAWSSPCIPSASNPSPGSPNRRAPSPRSSICPLRSYTWALIAPAAARITSGQPRSSSARCSPRR
jgi:hypothetical protein